MADISEVPIVEVHLGNYLEVWPSLVLAIRTSTFIAIDTELSGLGNRKQLVSKSVEDRYKAIVEVARSRSIISLGLSCYRLKIDHDDVNNAEESLLVKETAAMKERPVQFVVQTFNILVLCTESYVVEPHSLRFLVEHGFDFNKQYSYGLPYTRGNDEPDQAASEQSLRHLFTEVLLSRVPVVLHNALVDMIFLYECLYASLPVSLSSFLSDLSEMFTAGVYDTKFITEFVVRLQASYLEYTFRKSLRDNNSCASQGLRHTDVTFLTYPSVMKNYIVMTACGLTDKPCKRDVGKTTVCRNFASHGWCTEGKDCPKSHDVDLILDSEDWVIEKKKKKKSKRTGRRNKSTVSDSSKESDHESDEDTLPGDCMQSVQSMQLDEHKDYSNGLHRIDCPAAVEVKNADPSIVEPVNRVEGHLAGFDAFMTGYIFAALLGTRAKQIDGDATSIVASLSLSEEVINRIYLGGKDFPLQIVQSNFAKPSKNHSEKWARLRKSNGIS